MNELPKGWESVTLDQIAIWGSGGTPKRSEPSYYGDDIPWVKTGDLGPKFLKKSSEYISQAGLDNSSAKLFKKGSIAIAMYGATIGRTSILDFDTTTNQACAVGLPIEGITSTFFLYYLLNSEKNAFIKKGKGGAQPNISQQIIKSHCVTLPPLAEQKRIVEKLDEVLAQVDAIKTRLDNVPEILKRFRQSVLAAAVSGGFLKEKSKTICIKDISTLVTKGASPKWQGIDYVNDSKQTLFVTSENVGNSEILLNKKKFVQDFFNEKQKRSVLKKNDVLTNIVGASIGRSALWESNIKANINQAVCIIRLKEDICLPKYLLFFLNSPTGIEQLLSNKVDVARANVSLKTINELSFNLPPLNIQKEIVRLVDQYFAFADTIEKQVAKAQAQVNNLTQSILKKAFSGKLVAQNPNDEPAEQLLAKIAKARKEAEAIEKAAKKIKK